MQKFKAKILSTRPIDETLIQQALQQNIQIDVLRFIETEPIDSIEVSEEIELALMEVAIVVFTSMNAVDAVAQHIYDYVPDWRIYCIGNTTQKFVKKYFGEEMIAATADNAAELASIIAEDDATGEVIFFCGDKRRDELPSILNKHDIQVNEIEVYKTNLIHHTIQKNYDAILFFSPSAAESFFSTNTLENKTIVFAIGSTTAKSLTRFTKNKIIVADEPDKNELVEKAIEYFS